MPEQIDRFVVIKSNLAIPVMPDTPHAINNPLWEMTDPEVLFKGSWAFCVPEAIELRLYAGSTEQCAHPIAKKIRSLGCGVNAYIERNAPETAVRLDQIAKRDGGAKGQYLGWCVSGIASIPRLGLKEIPMHATDVAGHLVSPRKALGRAVLALH